MLLIFASFMEITDWYSFSSIGMVCYAWSKVINYLFLSSSSYHSFIRIHFHFPILPHSYILPSVISNFVATIMILCCMSQKSWEVLHLYTPNFLVYQPRACYGSVFPLPSELPLQPSSYQYICGNPYSMLLGNLYYPISHVHCASHQGALPLHRLIQYSNCNSHRWALCCCLDY